jgi:formylglycine-generating enzyme required for sulfatase activity/dienelactone hydrolase/predicted Ser/Thr protein kinase
MGEVYRARDLKLNRDAAVKVLPPHRRFDAARRARFTREAQAAAATKHPNIAVIYDIDESDGVVFIAMELVEGEPLSDVLGRGGVPLDRALDIALDVARGLASAHDRGVLHRDIKPANIVLTRDGHPKIIDFGIAKLLSESSDAGDRVRTLTLNETPTGRVLGTPTYMAPEQARGQPVDARCDVFAFGIVLHELVAGAHPFQTPSPLETANAIINQPHSRLPRDLPSVHREAVQRIIDRCLAKAPGDRYPSMIQVAADLEAAYRPDASASPFTAPRIAAAAMVLLAAGLFAWWMTRGSKGEVTWAVDTGIPELRRLVEADAYADAFAIATRVAAVLPNDTTLRELWPRLTQVVSVSTMPDDAEVSFRSASASNRAWDVLGRSPVPERRVPFGAFWIRVEKPGFRPTEVMFLGIGTYDSPDQARAITIVLEPTGTRTVAVPEGRLGIDLAGFETVEPIDLPAFRIDQFEVTNQEYKAFVDSGAYRNPALWRYEFRDGERSLSFDEAMARFRDQTGRPGPATWEVGSFTAGTADHPVSGVSWYEAAAYCESLGKALPTMFHWSAAARPASTSTVLLPTANVGERGLLPVGSVPAGLHGTRDMAGNVKEWIWNEAGDQRYILGGAWNEQSYQFYDPDAQAPLTRQGTYGLRCAQYGGASGEVLVAARRPIALPAPMGSLEPFSDQVFEAYKALFTFDQVPMDARIVDTDLSNPAWRREKVALRTLYGVEDLLVYLFLPASAAPPFQPVVYFPGVSAQSQRSPEELQTRMIDFVVQSGRAVIYPIYAGTHERRQAVIPRTDTRDGVDYVARHIGDLRRALDYLETRDDIQFTTLAYYGFSWGADAAPLFLAVEPRWCAAVLLDGGFDPVPTRPEIRQSGYAPRVRIPVLMINGSFDAYYQVEASQKPLFMLLGTPAADKRHVVYPTGHSVFTGYRNQAIRNILDWLDRYQGPVK